jgi:asparagine synthase (glutamine-hydrolysing)
MCGISGLLSLNNDKIPNAFGDVHTMNHLMHHRGPDGDGVWGGAQGNVVLGHKRLSIIDLSSAGSQPMVAENQSVIVMNGEIYNYIELQKTLASHWCFKTNSDTETVLAAYDYWGCNAVEQLRGMFSFALWDNKKQRLECVRDRFGIKPFYYTIQKNILYFASEAKCLLPFLDNIETDEEAFSEYCVFQYTIGEKTLFKGIKQLLPGHKLIYENSDIKIEKYWDINYNKKTRHNIGFYKEKLDDLIKDSIHVHLRSDVPVASYVSGGVDSSLVAILANEEQGQLSGLFHGKFTEYPGYDESHFAAEVAKIIDSEFHVKDITHSDFVDSIQKVAYHLDFPIAGPGSFPQYMVSQLSSEYIKVILGGQGGDEIFGGYARYVIAYLERCLLHAIDGRKPTSLPVSLQSMLPNLSMLKEYKPMLKSYMANGLFDSFDERYFRIVDRSIDFKNEVDWSSLNKAKVYEDYLKIFNNEDNISAGNYFDQMMNFDLKCSLPALLHVEDRMSMAHSIEARVPLLDHHIVEFAASIPNNIKFTDGKMKYLLKETYSNKIPQSILNRRDKMGFPVPLKEWFQGPLNEFVRDIFANNNDRQFLKKDVILGEIFGVEHFSRKNWAFLNLELWHQQFHDRHNIFKQIRRKFQNR